MLWKVEILYTTRRFQVCFIAAWLLVAMVTTAIACNIPVFRYALERWKADASEVVVFHAAELSPEQIALIEQLTAATVAGGGHANAEVVRVDVMSDADSARGELWAELKKTESPTLPYVLVRTKLGRNRFINHWHGSLATLADVNLFRSPARDEIHQRLLSGHSIVWVLIASSDREKTKDARLLTQGTFAALTKNGRLPEGIGLPGSELYSEVPLVLKFSLLEIEAGDPKESLLIRLLTGFRKEAYDAGEPLLVPVFGRGRALEVIPASDVSARLIEDLTLYLSGACSCQVKEQNPGFDLLIDADWDGELFDGEENLPPDRSDEEGQNRQPVLLDIPSGRK